MDRSWSGVMSGVNEVLHTSRLLCAPPLAFNQWARSLGPLPFFFFSCLSDAMQTRSRCGVTTEENAKSCWSVKIDLCNKTDSFSESWLSRLPHQCVFSFTPNKKKAHYQSTTGTISSSGWFPTTWSMKSSFPFGLSERAQIRVYLIASWHYHLHISFTVVYPNLQFI